MEAENCYMALEEDSLAVCQPEKNGKYESCRIFYDEMDKIVEGTRRGVPEFYIVIRKEGKEQKSFFLLDEEEQERDVFCVRSFGFDNQGDVYKRQDEYTYEALKLFLIGAIRRVFRPGSKFEVMLCLVGGQGAGKSTFFRLLAGRDEWHKYWYLQMPCRKPVSSVQAYHQHPVSLKGHHP